MVSLGIRLEMVQLGISVEVVKVRWRVRDGSFRY